VGELPAWLSANDVILEMLRSHDVDGGYGRIVEPGAPERNGPARHRQHGRRAGRHDDGLLVGRRGAPLPRLRATLMRTLAEELRGPPERRLG
jgi:hypothetical protein